MIDPTVRRCRADDADVDQLELLEHEAREALVGQRGGERWLVEHPPVGADGGSAAPAPTSGSPTSTTWSWGTWWPNWAPT